MEICELVIYIFGYYYILNIQFFSEEKKLEKYNMLCI